VHRIGRTGRAGRSGEAILFIAPRERNLLRAIERATRQPIEQMDLPTVETVNDARIVKFKQTITETLAAGELGLFRSLVEDYEREHNVPAIEVAAALAKMARGDVPLLLEPPRREQRPAPAFERERGARPVRPDRPERPERPAFAKKERVARPPQDGMQTFRVEVGYDHGVKPGNIVGAVANEANIESRHIGRIEIFEDHSLIDLPAGMPPETMAHLKGVWCAGQQLRITVDGEPPDTSGGKSAGRKPFEKKSFGKKPFPPRKTHRKGPRPE